MVIYFVYPSDSDCCRGGPGLHGDINGAKEKVRFTHTESNRLTAFDVGASENPCHGGPVWLSW